MKKKIFGVVALVFVLSLGLPMAAMAVTPTISLTPAEDQNVIGTSHQVDVDVDPVGGLDVTFSILSGPNDDEADVTVTTSGSGVASFSYVGDGGCGTDTIQATIVGTAISATVTKLWLYDKFSGGGKIIQEVGNKKKDYPKITWGGWAGNTCHDNNVNANPNGYYPVGQFEVTFHNVKNDALDKTKFVSYFVTQLSYADYSGTGCPDADPPPSDANFAQVRLFGEIQDEYGDFIAYGTIIINGMDNGEPGNSRARNGELTTDGIRFILYSGGSPIYDSYTGLGGDFQADQGGTCTDPIIGGVRHELDSGNLQIVWYD